MACSRPFLMSPNDRSRIKRPIYSPAQYYFPCGWCTNCRVDLMNQLVDRCEYEYCRHKSGAFVTFTYDDVNLLKHMHYDRLDGKLTASLSKSDAKHFLDRLNKRVHKFCKAHGDSVLCHRGYKYLLVGEYGENSTVPGLDRPHFHALFFGLDFALCEKLFAEAWQGRGSIMVGNIGDGACRYVVDYLGKALHGKMAEMKYDNHNMTRPFRMQSNGLGKGLYLSQKDYIKAHNYCYKWHNRDVPVPPYYKNKYMYDVSLSPRAIQLMNRKKQVDDFYQFHHRKPKSWYDLKEFQLYKARNRAHAINFKNFSKRGMPMQDDSFIMKQLLEYQFRYHNGYHKGLYYVGRLGLPPLDMASLIEASGVAHSVKVRRKSWQRRAVESSKTPLRDVPF